MCRLFADRALLKLFEFTNNGSLDEWEEKIIRGKVHYNVESKDGKNFLRAKSASASSGFYYKIKFDPQAYPLISWQWNVLEFPKKDNSPADDYAARFFVIFPAFFFKDSKCLEYVWDEDLPKETIMPSPYTPNIQLIVAESGRDKLNQWVTVKRDISSDYIKAFRKRPSLKVGAIAIMTDSDDTKSSSEALYGEIKIESSSSKKVVASPEKLERVPSKLLFWFISKSLCWSFKRCGAQWVLT